MKELSKVIGIISYFPDDKSLRAIRIKKLKQLVKSCSNFFNNIPVIIIAQNWPEKIELDNKNITIYRYPKPLTIVGARKELRKKFLETNYDYLIMLDDDCELYGTSAEEYLDQIDRNPNGWIDYYPGILKLFAISHEAFAGVDYDDISLERQEGFEDLVLYKKLLMKYPARKRSFFCKNFYEQSTSTEDKYSTWYRPGMSFPELMDKTVLYIQETYDEYFNPSGRVNKK